MVFSIVTGMCNHHQGHFGTSASPPKETLILFSCHPLLHHSRQALSNHYSTSCLYRFASSGYFIHRITQYMVFCNWPLSLNKVFSRYSHVAAGASTSFLFAAEQYSTVWIQYVGFSIRHFMRIQ